MHVSDVFGSTTSSGLLLITWAHFSIRISATSDRALLIEWEFFGLSKLLLPCDPSLSSHGRN